VLGDSGSKRGGVLEDAGPLLDGSDVVSHTLAGVEGLRDLESNDGELEDSLGGVVPSVLMKLGDSEVDLFVHEVASLVAGFDFLKVVFSGHTVDESSKELGDTSDRDVLDRHINKDYYLVDGLY